MTTEETPGDEGREVDKRIARLLDQFWYFYVDTEGHLRGATIDPHDADWDTLHLRLYTVERVPHYTKDLMAARLAEQKVRGDGRWDEYAAALAAVGSDTRTATAEQRCRAVLELYPEARDFEPTTEGVNDERTKRAKGFYPPVPYLESPSVQETRPCGFDKDLRSMRGWVVESLPPGRYAMWWPSEYQRQLSHTTLASSIGQTFGVLEGFEPYVYTALLYHLGMIEGAGAPVELPEELEAVYLRDDEGNHLIFSASKEKGLRFHFRVGVVSPEYRNNFWYRFWGYALAWREALDASGAPKYETGQSPWEWWRTSYEAAKVAEDEGFEVSVVGAIVV